MNYPEFVDDKTYIALDQALSEKAQLEAMLSNLTRIHLLSANKFGSFDELIHEYLKSGIEVFGLETGIVSQISDDRYTVCDVISPLSVLEKGQVFALEDTYCHLVIKSLQVIGLPHVGELDYMKQHPVYENLQLEAYLSAPIYAGNKLFGTLNFTSTRSRQHGFSQHERNLILLMANSIGAYIQLRENEDKLRALNSKMKKFVGYVAHDLRNPIGSIISLSALAEKKSAEPEKLQRILSKIKPAAEQALEFVTTILDNAALSHGKLELDRNTVDVKSFMQSTLDSVAEICQSNNKKIISHLREDGELNIDEKRLQQALSNLMINAIKYSPEASDIHYSIAVTPHASNFSIRNSVDETHVKDKSAEGSVGFGLEIVHEILKAHDSSLHTSIKDGEFTAEFCIASES